MSREQRKRVHLETQQSVTMTTRRAVQVDRIVIPAGVSGLILEKSTRNWTASVDFGDYGVHTIPLDPTLFEEGFDPELILAVSNASGLPTES